MAPRLERLDLPCPECGGVLTVRSSRQVSDVVREVYAECRNPAPHGPLAIKYLVEITADLHNGDYHDGLHIPASLRKQALAPVSKPDPRQVCIPGCEPVAPAHTPLTAHQLRCPKCDEAMRYVASTQVSSTRRELFALCFNPRCDGKYKVVVEAIHILKGSAPSVDLPRWGRPQALRDVAPQAPNQVPLLPELAAASSGD
jgi:ssDNA-binding Zn-finger/Zn-ribbon topoisomerase 1